MTENEAIKELQLNIELPFGSNISREATQLAIQALEEVQQYQKIGTPEELQDMKSNYFEALSDWRQYRKIGTLEECRTAREKQIPKKPILKNGETGSFVDYENGHGEYRVTKWQDWVCPICGWFVGQRYNRSQNHSHDQRKCKYCNECGQKIDWSDND